MNIIFMGTPEFAVPSLRKLGAAKYTILTVVTQPDKPSSRGRKISVPPVKRVAQELGLPVCQPEKIKSDKFYNELKELKPDVIVVVAFGRILPGRIIYLPPQGSINLHPSLLPKYRGAAPINWVIANGEKETGCTTMFMDEGMDTGDILLSEGVSINPEENALELSQRLSVLGADLLSKTLKDLEQGELSPKKQDNSKATFAPMLKKEDGLINWSLSAEAICSHIRGMYPWPGSHTYFRDLMIKFLKAQPIEPAPKWNEKAQTGEIIFVSKDEIAVTCGQNTFLSLLQIQPQNRSVISAKEFINGYHPKVGEIFRKPSSF